MSGGRRGRPRQGLVAAGQHPHTWPQLSSSPSGSCRSHGRAAYRGGSSGKPSFLPCLLMSDLCCRAGCGQAGGSRVSWAGNTQAARAAERCPASCKTASKQSPAGSSRASPASCTPACRRSPRTHDVGDHTATRDGGLDQRVQLLITTDGQLQVARRDTLHLEILGGVASQLQHLRGRGGREGCLASHQAGHITCASRGRRFAAPPC